MTVIVEKTKLDAVNLNELQREINTDPLIVPSCLSITQIGTLLKIEFAVELSAAEDAILDTIVSDHVPPVESVDSNQLPFSPSLGKKLHVHRTFKPDSDKIVYAVWTGAGDDLVGSAIGEGPLLHFTSVIDTNIQTVEVEFLPDSGRVWIHEGYLKFEGAGAGDYMEADVRAHPTPLQTTTDLDLILSGNKIKPAPSGPGTGTHGFDLVTGSPVPIPRTFSMNGDWDIINGILVPNFDGTGLYALNQTERTVHRFVNKIPCYGNNGTYFAMSSDETIEIHKGFFLRIRQLNESNTVWHASVIVEIYRERTHAQQ